MCAAAGAGTRWAPTSLLEGRGDFTAAFHHQDGGLLCTSLLCHLESCKEKPGRRSPGGVGGGG